jgi:hypothetical protein
MDHMPVVIFFFPASGRGAPLEISESNLEFYNMFIQWHMLIGKDASLFLVDSVILFAQRSVNHVKYLVVRLPTCSISFMEKSIRRDPWMTLWDEPKLISYGKLVGTQVAKNMVYIGGICHYVLNQGAAQEVIMAAIEDIGVKQ